MKEASTNLFKGVHHAGIGVSDMQRSLDFYKNTLGFSEVVAHYAGELPGMEPITGRHQTNAHVVFLRNPRATRLGAGMIKLVQLLAPDSPGPTPEGVCWGEIGVAEVCVHTRNVEAMLKRLVNEAGCRQTTAVDCVPVPPPRGGETAYGYIEDPDGGKVELLEWRPPSGSRPEPHTEGVAHVAFGVSDADRAKAFYKTLGFTAELIDFECVQQIMDAWFAKDPAGKELRLVIMDNPEGGAGIEIVKQLNRKKDCRGSWGHLGPMEFAIEVGDIEQACAVLRRNGLELLGSPQTVAADTCNWTYIYLAEPDGNFVSLIQPGF